MTLKLMRIPLLRVANSARSQMAEGQVRAMPPTGIAVGSAGAAPGVVHSPAVEAPPEAGIGVSAHRSRPLEQVALETADQIVTLRAAA